jgi:D-sedoheptulose 7-phosphate isomerase
MVTVSGYLDGVRALLDAVNEDEVHRLAEHLYEAWRAGKHILLLGNGGSSGTASHIVNDLQKCIQLDTGRAIKAMCLSDCTPLVMAWANDTEFANVYAPQVECWGEPGDLMIAISGSGNSPNIIRAVETGNRIGVHTFGLAGFSGGKLAEVAAECITVRSNNMQQIEDLHMILLHMVFTLLRERVTRKD